MFKIILPKIKFRVEKWKWNSEFRIYVSNLGHIKDEYKKNMPIKINSSGYCNVETKYGYKAIHRLVLLTFKPIPNAEDLTVDHLNHNKRDNSLDNLEWVSQKVNVERAVQDFVRTNEPMVDIYFCGNQKFINIDKAIDWVIASNGSIMSNPDREKIKYRINKAISTQELYCNKKWKKKQVIVKIPS